MATYAWAELIKRWESERLTTEQVIGQLLQQGQQSQTTVQPLVQTTQRRQEALEQALAALSTRVAVMEKQLSSRMG